MVSTTQTNQNKEFTQQEWGSEVVNSDIPVFVDFWAEWCGPCRMVSPVVDDLSKEYTGKVKFVKVNVDQNKELASKYNIMGIPTLAIFYKGKIVAQQVGAASKSSLKSMVDGVKKD